MEYKWSRFILENGDGENAILVSLMYFDSFRLSRNSLMYGSYKLGDVDILSDKEKEYLYNRHFIVEKDVDEIEFCDFVRMRSVYADSILDITILPTDTCNFKCVYCYETSRNRFLSDEAEASILKYVRKNIHKYKQIRLAWFGGEPLVRKEQVIRITKSINELCKKAGVLFSGSIVTNAYELDLDTFQALVQNKILAYQICIDGSKESHNRQRPHAVNPDSYERILKNIYDIKNFSSTNTFVITLRSNIAYETEQYMEPYLREIYSIVGNDKRFEIVFQGIRDWGGERIGNHDIGLVKEEEGDICKKWYIKAAEIGLNSAECLDLSIKTSMCVGNFVTGYIIDTDCSVHKCTLAFVDEKDRESGHIGTLQKDGRMELDYYKIMKWTHHESHNQKCMNCVLYPICKGGACPYSSNIKETAIYETKHCLELQSMVDAKIACLEMKGLIPEYGEEN